MSSYDGRWGRHAGDWPAGDRADRGTEQRLTRWAVEDLVRQVEHTAFCFEVMPGEPKGRGDRKDLERYERGDLETLTKLMRSERSLLYVRSLVEAGKRVERVRVWDDPPTPFQAMRRWMATWNVAAGEVVRYLSHDRAAEVGLSPAVQAGRWWLLDSCRVVQLDANPGRLLTSDPHQAVTDPSAVVEACGWRDAAWHHSTPDVEDASDGSDGRNWPQCDGRSWLHPVGGVTVISGPTVAAGRLVADARLATLRAHELGMTGRGISRYRTLLAGA